MALFPNWGNLDRLDVVTNTNEIVLYRDNEPLLTAEKGVSLGLLKLIYSSESRYGCGNLLGVKPREGTVQRVITLDSTILDKDEYDMIIQDQFPQSLPSGFFSLQPPKQNLSSETSEQLLAQTSIPLNNNQMIFQPTLQTAIPQPTVPFLTQFLPNMLQQTVQSFSPFNTSIPRALASLPEFLNPLSSSDPSFSKEDHPTSSLANVFSTENPEASANTADNSSTQAITELSETGNDKPIEQDDTVSEGNYIDTAKFPFQCEVCHIPFKSKSKFKHHQRRHTEEKPYLCTYCGDSFKHFFELSKHRNELHLCNKSFKCGQCPKSFSTRKELNHHMWRHTGEKMHTCDVCGKQYSSTGNLRLHKQKHKGTKPFKCPLCPKTFFHKSVLENHIRSGHTGEKPFACRFCDKAFPNNSQLSSHLKRHSDSRPHICNICGKSFRQGHILKRHSILHTSERPYKCHMCPKTFRESGNLQYHMSTHQSKADRLVLCPFCDKAVIIGRGIRRHLKIHHTDECPTEELIENLAKSLKPDRAKAENILKEKAKKNQGNLPCPGCEKKCKSITGLKKHFSTEHPDTELTKEMINGLLSDSAFDPDSDSYQCRLCERRFRSQQRLNNHKLITHPDQMDASEVNQIQSEKCRKKQKRKRNNVCKNCGKEFFLRSTLKSHLAKDHEASKETPEGLNNNKDGRNQGECIEEQGDGEKTNCIDTLENDAEAIDLVLQENLVSFSNMNGGEPDLSSTVDMTQIEKALSNVAEVLCIDEKTVGEDDNARKGTVAQKNEAEIAIENPLPNDQLGKKEPMRNPAKEKNIRTKRSPVSCTLCQRKFCSVKTLANHMALCHKEYRTVLIDPYNKSTRKKCKFCVMSFAYPATLDRHIEKVHAHLQCIQYGKSTELGASKDKGSKTGQDEKSTELRASNDKESKTGQEEVGSSTKQKIVEKVGKKKRERKTLVGKFGNKTSTFKAALDIDSRSDIQNAKLKTVGAGQTPLASKPFDEKDQHNQAKPSYLAKVKHGDESAVESTVQTQVKENKILTSQQENAGSSTDSSFVIISSTSEIINDAESCGKDGDDRLSTVDKSVDKITKKTNHRDSIKKKQTSMHVPEIINDARSCGKDGEDRVSTVNKAADPYKITKKTNHRDSIKKKQTSMHVPEIINDARSCGKDGEDRLSTVNKAVDSYKITKKTNHRDSIKKKQTSMHVPVINPSDFLKLQAADWQSKTVKADTFPFMTPDSLTNPAPLGYSYAYLPVLVPNTEENTPVKETNRS